MNVLLGNNFPFVIKNILLGPGGIIVTTPFAIRPNLFENKLRKMAFVDPLIICFYYSDAPTVGPMTTLA